MFWLSLMRLYGWIKLVNHLVGLLLSAFLAHALWQLNHLSNYVILGAGRADDKAKNPGSGFWQEEKRYDRICRGICWIQDNEESSYSSCKERCQDSILRINYWEFYCHNDSNAEDHKNNNAEETITIVMFAKNTRRACRSTVLCL